MKPSYATALVIGAVSGLVLGLSLMLYAASTGGVPSVNALVQGDSVVPVFAVPASALWVVVILTGAFGGLIAAIATKAVARAIDPDAASASLVVIAPLGAVIAAIISMTVFPLGSVVFGSIDEGIVTLGVVAMVGLAGATGAVAGGFIVWLSYILARPPSTETDTSLLAETADRSA